MDGCLVDKHDDCNDNCEHYDSGTDACTCVIKKLRTLTETMEKNGALSPNGKKIKKNT